VSYSGVWVKGEMVEAGERPCEDRYQAIRRRLEGLARPSVLDVGANTGVFGIRLAEDFGGRATLADDRTELGVVVERQENPALTVLPRRLAPGDLRALPRHDVVLALSVLHHFKDWRGALGELSACRRWLICEVPHPDERWMRSAASRRELPAIYEAVSALGERICTSKRIGRDGATWERETFAIPGTVRTFEGEVFAGSGNNSRSLDAFADDSLTEALGYEPYHGSLNLRVGDFTLGEPHVRWARRIGKRRRSYSAWRAWFGEIPGHVVIPTTKPGWAHPGTLECWAPVRLRDALGLEDGGRLTVDVEE
jgi:CTP-dependent riboflavin kinase